MLTKLVSTLAIGLVAAMLHLGAFAAPVNVNTADAEALAENIVGVGPKLAQAIIDYRQEHGPFASIEELERVRGIGPKLIEKNRADLLIETASE